MTDSSSTPGATVCSGLSVLVAMAAGLLAIASAAQEPAAVARPVDPSTLRHKVLCGYQGWFRCPGDGTGEGWLHWSRTRDRIAPELLTVEMWPDLTEFSEEEKFPAPGFTLPDGSPAALFSSAHPRTVERHFRWMQAYDLDGVFVQRFLVNTRRPSFDRVLEHVREAARRTGRVYAIGYDLTGFPRERMFERLTSDWKMLVDERKVTADERYLHEGGKPVLMIWGFFSDRFEAELAHRIIDFFKHDPRYGVTLIGGTPWYWRRERDAGWARAFRRFDVISPWNVGHYVPLDGQRHAATAHWKEDRDEARQAGMRLLPVIYPGFGWTNLKGPQASAATAPRLGGAFYWRQFVEAQKLGLDMAYVAMFDEVDEGTAIFKVTNQPPVQARLQTYEGLPTDWYLRLTAEGARLIRGQREATETLPIRP